MHSGFHPTDPTLAEEDTLSLRAFRLSDSMYKLLKQNKGNAMTLGPDEYVVVCVRGEEREEGET